MSPLADHEPDRIAAFTEARELAPAERATYLADLRCRNPAAADEVGRLLESHEELGDFLEAPPAGPALSNLFHEPEDQIGRTLGAYRLKSVLGVGGMSVVYAADRADERFSKTVAIKLVRAEGDEDLVRRIDRERRVLARLEHPNIARLLDSGEAEDGSPFIVMEKVDGPSVDRYCDEHRLGIEDRLRVFVTVCSAVEYARSQGIIHRDLKPSNVLVSGAGTVKLLDFGIAKAVDGIGVGAELTQTGAALMTPLYASPEQIAGTRISPATDVYTLGVLLYELLSGVHPYRGAASVAQVLDAVRRSEPPLPSASAAEAAGPALAARRTTATGLSRRLGGDLDNIVRKTMHRDPSRRYRSAGELAADVQRHLEARPVLARPDTLRYRFGKWLLRNRIPVAAATTVLLFLLVAAALSASQFLRLGLGGLLIAAITTVTILFLRADEARRSALQFRTQAERERERATRVSGFLTDMLASVDPQISQGRDTGLLTDILESSASRIDNELGDHPEVAAEIHLVLWRTFNGLTRFSDAARHAKRAAELTEFDQESDLWVDVQIALADTEATLGELEKAEQILKRCAVKAQRTPRTHLDHLAVSANNRASLGDGAGEEKLRRKAVDVARQSPQDRLALATQLQWLGRRLVVTGRKEDGEPLLLEALELLAKEPDPLQVVYLRTVYALALLWLGSGRPDRAEGIVSEALERAIEVYGEEHVETALLTNLMARAVESRGELAEAEILYRRNVEIMDHVLGSEHRSVGSAWNDLAYFHLRTGKLEESAEEYQKAILAHTKFPGQGLQHPSTTQSRRNYAAVLLETGDAAEAEKVLREVMSIPEPGRPNLPYFADMTEFLLGACLVDLGQHSEGRTLLDEHMRTLDTEFGSSYARVLVEIGRTRLKVLDRARPGEGGPSEPGQP